MDRSACSFASAKAALLEGREPAPLPGVAALPAYRWLVEDSIYLSPAARGRGAGSALLAELLTRCTALGLSLIHI